MEQFVCIYCEGNDSKFAVFERDKGKLRLIKTASIDLFKPSSGAQSEMPVFDAGEGELTLESLAGDMLSQNMNDSVGGGGQLIEGVVNAELAGIKLHQCKFVPILTEPALFYQTSNKKGTTGAIPKFTQEVTSEAEGKLKSKKKTTKSDESVGQVEIAEGATLRVRLRSDTSCIQLVNKLARFNNRRFYKISSVKSAEISLATYVAKRKKFFPDDYSLVVYIGKEYSKLIFLYGRKIKHIGSTLDIGTTNLHTYDVYFSKILLEMENGAVPNLDNIIVCGEDVSENLVLSFYGTFPEINVSRLEFDDVDISGLSETDIEKVSSFSVPIAAMSEIHEELIKKTPGINLIPNWVVEEQKLLQFAWHGYLMLPLLVLVPIFITLQILTGSTELKGIENEIRVKEQLKQQNLEIVAQIEALDGRINSFDQTQTILDSVSVGSEVWGRTLNRFSSLGIERRGFWLSKISIDEKKFIQADGYSLNTDILPQVTARLDSATLKSVYYEPIRESDAYRFQITLREQ